MGLWWKGAWRQWQKHRFVTLLLVIGYGLGLVFAALVYMAITGQAIAQRDLSMGDSSRLLSVQIHAPEGIPLELDKWMSGMSVSWGWVALPDVTLGSASSAPARSNVMAWFGDGPLDWAPPLRSGRFLSADEMRNGEKVLVVGETLSVAVPGYSVIGIAKEDHNRGWSRAIFVPLAALPAQERQRRGIDFSLHLELTEGQNLAAGKRQLLDNLMKALPGAGFAVHTEEEFLAADAVRFSNAYAKGFALTAVLLAFVALNVGALSMHWIMQRRREIAVRLALGSTMREIVAMIVFEHSLVALVGASLAVPLIWLGMFLGPMAGLPIRWSAGVPVIMFIALFGMTGVSSAIPLRNLLKSPLRDNLQWNE